MNDSGNNINKKYINQPRTPTKTKQVKFSNDEEIIGNYGGSQEIYDNRRKAITSPPDGFDPTAANKFNTVSEFNSSQNKLKRRHSFNGYPSHKEEDIDKRRHSMSDLKNSNISAFNTQTSQNNADTQQKNNQYKGFFDTIIEFISNSFRNIVDIITQAFTTSGSYDFQDPSKNKKDLKNEIATFSTGEITKGEKDIGKKRSFSPNKPSSKKNFKEAVVIKSYTPLEERSQSHQEKVVREAEQNKNSDHSR